MMSFIHFVLNEKVILSALGVAVLDLAFALNPKLNSNGILHSIYLFISNIKSGPSAPAVVTQAAPQA